ncbi:hypothetical protein [Bosea sp. AAP35]|nr:hypothetical protein [Bosea sp. AAP35]
MMRSEESSTAPRRCESMFLSMICGWSEQFLLAGKRLLAGETARGDQ